MEREVTAGKGMGRERDRERESNRVQDRTDEMRVNRTFWRDEGRWEIGVRPELSVKEGARDGKGAVGLSSPGTLLTSPRQLGSQASQTHCPPGFQVIALCVVFH